MEGRLKILVVSPQLPFPMVDGAKRAIFHPLRTLSELGHEIRLVCLSESLDLDAVRELEHYCQVEVVLHSKKRSIRGTVAGLFQASPYFLSRFHHPEVLARVKDHVRQGIDILHLETLHCAYYGLELRKHLRVPTVLRLHNVESVILDRYARLTKNPFVKAYVRFEAGRVAAYEKTYCSTFDRLFMISAADAATLTGLSGRLPVVVLPAGVDSLHFSPKGEEEAGTVLWMAGFRWPPNRDSFWWFVNSIVPELVRLAPSVRILVAGSHPPPEILSFQHPNVEILGHVADIRDPIDRASVVVVPLRIGGGIRLKLLELFAMEKAVVSTSIGCEGLAVEDGKHLVVADSEEDFAQSVAGLLKDSQRRKRLGLAARAIVESRFSWDAIVSAYISEYEVLRMEAEVRAE